MENTGVVCQDCGRPLKISKSNANRGEVVGCTYCRQRTWYLQNKERVSADSKAYYQQTRERRIQYAKDWRAANLEKHRRDAWRYKLKRKYGLTLEQVEQMVKDQNGLCFLCGGKPPKGKPLSIDHCHKENRVRKLLCQMCNLSLGIIERDPTWVDRAVQYLKS